MRNSKRKLVFSLISLVLITSVLFLSTFERRQSGFSVFGRTFFAGNENGNFEIELYWSRDPASEEWKNVEVTGNDIPFGSDVRWEPDHTEIRYFKVKNAGDYDFNYSLGIDIPESELTTTEYAQAHPIGDVIDVYCSNNINDLSSKTLVGTLNECFQSPDFISGLQLEKNGSATYALVFTMKHGAGNEYQGVYDQNNNKLNNIGFKICAGAYADEPDPEYDGDFGAVLPNSQNPDQVDFLYRVGTTNSLPASELFYINDSSTSGNNNPLFITAFAADFDSSLLTFTYERIAGSNDVGFEFNPGSGSTGADYLSSSRFTFKGNGVIKVKMLYNGQIKKELCLEVVSGKNIFLIDDDDLNEANLISFGSSTNIVLFDNISSSSRFTVPNGKTLYGNGYSLISTTTENSSLTQKNQGFLHITNGSVDNVEIKGLKYENFEYLYGGGNNYSYAPCLSVADGGDAKIYNCLVEECRVAVKSYGKLYAENTTFAGGTNGNIEVANGSTTLKNCITSTSLRGGRKGLGVIISSNQGHLTLEGSFKQYNWIAKNDLEDPFKTLLSDIFNDSEYAKNSKINGGVLCFQDGTVINESVARGLITDNTDNPSNSLTYGYLTKTKSLGTMTQTATAYTQKAQYATDADVTGISSFTPLGQYPTVPAYSFDYTSKNYIAKTTGSDLYCYYDQGKVNISFPTETQDYFEWDPMILSASKYGSSVAYSVSMNNTDYTNGKIHFSQSGDYSVEYTLNDTIYYGPDAESGNKAYTFYVNISVTAVDPEVVVYHPEFSYGTNYGTSSKQVIASDSKTYVMPNVDAVSDNYGSKTVGGQTVYFPIVNVTYNVAREVTCYAPAFKAIQIVDKNKDTGNTLYTYNSSSQKWPHNQNASNGPQSDYFSIFSGNPYEPNSGASGQSMAYESGQGGLVYKSGPLNRTAVAGNKDVCFCYVGNDGFSYYYYIRFVYVETAQSSTCFTEGTQITMADSTQKPIENVTYEDRLLTYNFFTGETEAKDIAILVNHGKDYYKVLNLEFKDGTILRFIGDHGVFDYTLNKYVFMTEDNYKEYIGHKFVRFSENGKFKKVKLADVSVTEEYTTAYSITSAQNSNVLAQNLLTVAPPDEFYNWIDMGRKMRYDKKQFDADVAKYGLYDYSVFKDYVSYDEFIAFNGPYLKVAVEKGKFTFDDIIELIDLYGKFMQ